MYHGVAFKPLSGMFPLQLHCLGISLIVFPYCRDIEKHREIATLEAQVYRFVELLSEQRSATRENVQRKQAQTGG